ncbi:MAG TPA: cupin domain-containing protein [Thermoanaerobaculia bacterium]|nr:cupin domain-containing protein [Thermoanaerobaculia bacterium]
MRTFKAVLTSILIFTPALIASAHAPETKRETNRDPRIIPIRAMSQDVEILYGDPEAVGEPFVMRIRELPGGVIPPHRHPVDEHITVVQGTIYFGIGDKFERSALQEIKAGGYAFIPKGSTMFGFTPEAAIVQVHGVGPFHIHWRAGNAWNDKLKTLDDADAASVFKFKKGERVVAKRGRGRIRQGYDSGEVIAYEIDGDDGTLFMAEEADLQRESPDH